MKRRVIWTKAEAALQEVLVDNPLVCPWSMLDLLEHYRLLDAEVDDDAVRRTTEMVVECLPYVHRELAKNPTVFPPYLLRAGFYPYIRQMRDVHDFDVGSHLAFCHALAVRDAPTELVRSLNLRNVADTFATTSFGNALSVGSAAVFHDFFKTFRTRRPLPSKIGEAVAISWTLPDGRPPTPEVGADENSIARVVLPCYIRDEALADRLCHAISLSGRVGSFLYRLLDTPDDAIHGSVEGFLSETEWGPDTSHGLYLAVVDLMGKGWASYLITYRKNRRRSLFDAGIAFLTGLDKFLANTPQGSPPIAGRSE